MRCKGPSHRCRIPPAISRAVLCASWVCLTTNCVTRVCLGTVQLASEPDRLEEFRRIAAFNRMLGVDVQEISASDVKQLAPLTRVDDILAGFYVPTDGRVNPVDVTMALVC
jgi:glycine/D-amino acid oxidase-like deaminating enzyme